ncbi:signal recognition particle receptor beta subunit (macronuclear) [Tetrahymena thermophila SB210]|uniref:Signal recognition particle receptor subunit beta n=1 Tax=Tetrahymena thermophila (strain SB210) TaxID=312017 RepID=Q22CM5_TETTS|nr:signal recognition particle receptor beta subunit [Tetrahymena thermophila SB210]EAR83027.2 signal recognition particle receptor beta subunit [Tetrahymena thermophila SB210]|eukprot:XP_001030690.2 signal recognition particle receptor beta subunit [Tetrahymena thermophila SB210]
MGNIESESVQQNVDNVINENVAQTAGSGFSFTPVLVALLLIALTLYFILNRSGKKPPMVKNKGNAVFIMGECAAGKTALLYQLANGQTTQTCSSIDPTETNIEVKFNEDESKKISFVDVPGHNYTKHKFINELGAARGIIFLIDSSNLNSYGNSVDYLYHIMIQKVFQDKEIPVLLCANKADQPKALKLKDFEYQVVKEFEKVKRSKKAIQEEENDQIEDYLKHQDQEFSFQGTNITLCETSVVNNEIKPIKEFLQNIFS